MAFSGTKYRSLFLHMRHAPFKDSICLELFFELWRLWVQHWLYQECKDLLCRNIKCSRWHWWHFRLWKLFVWMAIRPLGSDKKGLGIDLYHLTSEESSLWLPNATASFLPPGPILNMLVPEPLAPPITCVCFSSWFLQLFNCSPSSPAWLFNLQVLGECKNQGN